MSARVRWQRLGALTVAALVLLAGCDDSTIDDTPVEVNKVAFTEPLAIPPLGQ